MAEIRESRECSSELEVPACVRLDFSDSIDDPPSEEDRFNSSTDSGMVHPSPRPKQVGKVTPIQRHKKPLRECNSPPYQGIRTLRLFGSPQTPKTLLERSQSRTDSLPRTRARLFQAGGSARKQIIPSSPNGNSGTRRTPMMPHMELMEVNVNPFTPKGQMESHRKRPRTEAYGNNNNVGDCDLSICQVEEEDLGRQAKIQKMYLSPNDEAYSRYEQEFLELEQIGSGEFGSVFKCINRLDGCVYAIKKHKKPMKGSHEEKASLTEVWAHAVLGANKHVVRYYSAWAEQSHMIIQNEYCNGGSLQDQLQDNQANEESMSEPQLRRLALHLAQGLKFIHGQNLVHMDIKPGNVFISKQDGVSEDDGFEEDEEIGIDDRITYKIGDLGLVTSTLTPKVEEGDCRYMAPELLLDDHTSLPKADIFSLGMTLYEAGTGKSLPKNGELWQRLRRGELDNIDHCSEDFNRLIQRLCHPEPSMRPSAQQLTVDPILVPYTKKSKAQLRKELNAEKFRTKLLEQQLQQAAMCLQRCPGLSFNFLSNPSPIANLSSPLRPNARKNLSSRLVGRGSARSNSVQQF